MSSLCFWFHLPSLFFYFVASVDKNSHIINGAHREAAKRCNLVDCMLAKHTLEARAVVGPKAQAGQGLANHVADALFVRCCVCVVCVCCVRCVCVVCVVYVLCVVCVVCVVCV